MNYEATINLIPEDYEGVARPENVKVDDGFWLEYSDKQAAKVTRQMEKAIREPGSKSHTPWEHINKPETLVEDYLNACETLSITPWQAIEDHSSQADSRMRISSCAARRNLDS